MDERQAITLISRWIEFSCFDEQARLKTKPWQRRLLKHDACRAYFSKGRSNSQVNETKPLGTFGPEAISARSAMHNAIA
jgi:hypothetical protein